MLQAVAKGHERLEQHKPNKLHKNQQLSYGILFAATEGGRVSKIVKKLQDSDTTMLS